MAEKITRFDIPDSVQKVLNVAVEQNVIDIKDVIVLGSSFGMDWKGMVDEIVEYAYSNRHIDNSHDHVCRAAEGFWKEVY